MTLPSIPLDVLFEDWIKIYIMLLFTVVIVAFGRLTATTSSGWKVPNSANLVLYLRKAASGILLLVHVLGPRENPA